jgi:hypothetical protein
MDTKYLNFLLSWRTNSSDGAGNYILKSAKNHAITAFKMAMMNYDQELFMRTYNWLIEEKSFKEIFHQVFIPLLEELGYGRLILILSYEHFMIIY